MDSSYLGRGLLSYNPHDPRPKWDESEPENSSTMPQSTQERKYCHTAGGALMEHDVPFVAVKVVAVVEGHS